MLSLAMSPPPSYLSEHYPCFQFFFCFFKRVAGSAGIFFAQVLRLGKPGNDIGFLTLEEKESTPPPLLQPDFSGTNVLLTSPSHFLLADFNKINIAAHSIVAPPPDLWRWLAAVPPPQPPNFCQVWKSDIDIVYASDSYNAKFFVFYIVFSSAIDSACKLFSC